MSQLAPKPAGSVIEEADVFEGRSYHWYSPKGGITRYLQLVFAVIFCVIWYGGVSSIIIQMIQDKNRDLFEMLFMIPFVLAGLIPAMIAWLAIRRGRPESVILGHDLFRHDPGSPPTHLMFDPFAAMQSGRRPMISPFDFFKRRKKIEKPLQELGPVTLDRVGERQRLYFDNGADRIEIGEFLREPEREWLAKVIQDWQGS